VGTMGVVMRKGLGQCGSMNLVLALCAVVVVAAAFDSSAGAAGAPTKDAQTIACPAAPNGWNSPPVVKTLATPESVPAAAAEEHFATGGNLVSVQCTYHDTVTKQVTVDVSYALPADANPFADFDVGCGNGSMSWNTAYRVYRVSSLDQWAIATLAD